MILPTAPLVCNTAATTAPVELSELGLRTPPYVDKVKLRPSPLRYAPAIFPSTTKLPSIPTSPVTSRLLLTLTLPPVILPVALILLTLILVAITLPEAETVLLNR